MFYQPEKDDNSVPTNEVNFKVTLDLGILFQGSPDLDLSSQGGVLTNDPTFQAELQKEQDTLEDDISGFTIWPVIAVGFSWKF